MNIEVAQKYLPELRLLASRRFSGVGTIDKKLVFILDGCFKLPAYEINYIPVSCEKLDKMVDAGIICYWGEEGLEYIITDEAIDYVSVDYDKDPTTILNAIAKDGFIESWRDSPERYRVYGVSSGCSGVVSKDILESMCDIGWIALDTDAEKIYKRYERYILTPDGKNQVYAATICSSYYCNFLHENDSLSMEEADAKSLLLFIKDKYTKQIPNKGAYGLFVDGERVQLKNGKSLWTQERFGVDSINKMVLGHKSYDYVEQARIFSALKTLWDSGRIAIRKLY